MTPSKILGFVGTGLVASGYVPQIVHLITERCTAGIGVPGFSVWSGDMLAVATHPWHHW